MDVVNQQVRSRMMAGIRGKDTRLEVAIRKRLFAMGFRYRLHVTDLPGKPDLVFPRYHTVVFINGCFWHHHDCNLFRLPGTHTDFWKEKLEGNRRRDMRNIQQLLNQSWRIIILWECAWRFPGVNREEELTRICQRVSVFLLQMQENILEIRKNEK